ncbi:MAG: M3 family oligoendopeptidase [Thermoanaerobaculia bacterium]
MTAATLAREPETLSTTAWDLSELIPGGSAEGLAGRLAELESAVARFERHRQELGPTMGKAALLAVVREYEAVLELLSVVESYASLRFSADTQTPSVLSDQARVQQASMKARNSILFFEIWWKSLSDAEAEALAPSSPESADQAFFLAEVRRRRAHSLEEKSEQIIILKDTDGIEALVTLYSMLTNRMEFELTTPKGVERLNRDELISFVYSEEPELREAAYRELLRVYGNEVAVLSQIYGHRVRDWYNEQVSLRGFTSPIGARNFANDIPDAAVEALLAVCRQHIPLFHRFFRLKARLLGMDKLRRFDIYAPIAGQERTVGYEEAIRTVLGVFQDFHPTVANLASRVFDQRHIDSELRRGKRTGAFCATVSPRLTPWVLVNFTERLRDVATLAHELGHAVHSMLAGHHSLLTQRATLPLAETASVFAEMLVTDHLLAQEKDPATRRYLLASTIDNIYAAVIRQAYFVLFEVTAHQAILDGGSYEDLNALYLENLRDQFGDAVLLPEEFRHEWLNIPHFFHTPFYCYAYSFGQLLVLALYRRFQEEGEAFKPVYLELLSKGASQRPHAILAEAGVDVTDPAFWQLGFEVIRGKIDELESMG